MMDYVEIAKRPSLMEVGEKITVCDVLDFLISPFYEIAKGAYRGYKQAESDAEKEVDKFLAGLDARAEAEEQKHRKNRLDDLQYEAGLTALEKSRYDLAKMLNPTKRSPIRKPKISHIESYKVYD